MFTWPLKLHGPASLAITGYLYYLYAVLPASIPQEKENVQEEGKKRQNPQLSTFLTSTLTFQQPC